MTYALNQMDNKILKKYLCFSGGVFVEAGANDGIRQSNTLLFEREHQWRGLLVEPNPTLFESCKKNRPNSIVEQCALVSFDYKLDIINWSTGPGLDGNNDTLCAQTIHDDGNLPEKAIPHLKHRAKEKIQVPANTITNLLKKHNISNIDFFSLDVEGYEFSVLNGLDFSYVRPKYILLEVTENFDRMKSYMEERNYTYLEKFGNHDYLFKDET